MPYILGNGNPRKASYIPGNGTFQLKLKKNKKSLPRKKFLIFWEMELSNSKIKKFLIFCQKNTFHLFSQRKPRAPSGLGLQKPALKIFFLFSQKSPNFLGKILTFQEMEFSYTLGNGTFLYFRKGIYRTMAYLEAY